eukprot:7540011-Lingulodinium_polyedra.AAC.1
MRLRSRLLGTAGAIHRARSSKVQNNVVDLCCRGEEASYQLPVLLELQPLANKDGDTLALAILNVLRHVINAIKLSPQKRFIHVLVGD